MKLSERFATLAIGRDGYDYVPVMIDGKEEWLKADDAKTYHEANKLELGRRNHFHYDYKPWFENEKKRYRFWKAELITADNITPLSLTQPTIRGGWGAPLQEIARLLDELSAGGWRIVHISEDHGLYVGADAADEAYLTRVRYLLSR